MKTCITNDTAEYGENLFFGFRNYLYEEHGIFINLEKKESVITKLQERMNLLNLSQINEYLYILSNPLEYENEKPVLFDILDFNDYYFHSTPDQVEATVNEILPDIFNDDERLKEKNIRILVIGKSSLMQAYSMFFSLNNAFRNKKPEWEFQIHAYDLDKNNTGKQIGKNFDKKSLINLDDEAVKKYFTKTDDYSYKIKDTYSNTISFFNFDFLKPCPSAKFNLYDLIFCRNIMLFYKSHYKTLLASNLFSLLKPGGFLFLGDEESLHGISPEFKLFLFPGTLAYKKENAS